MYALSVTVPTSEFSSPPPMRSFSGRTPIWRNPVRLRASGGTRTIVPSVNLTVPSPTTSPVEKIRDAEEAGHERRPGRLVELGRRAELLDVTAVHDHDPVGHGHGLFLVVRDVDERDPDLVLDPLQLELHLLPQLEVERAERLVEEEHARPVHERAGECDPLLLTARELPRLAPLEPGEADELERLDDPCAQLALLDAAASQPEGDVLEDREVREERVRLEHGVDVALVRGQRRDVDAARARSVLRSAPRSRRSSVASSSCRSPTGRAERRNGRDRCRARWRRRRRRRRSASSARSAGCRTRSQRGPQVG